MVDETVFQAFPNAVVSVQLLSVVYSTIEGNIARYIGDIDAIVDEESSTEFNTSPNAAPILSTTLLYVRPEQMPTTDCESLQASYGIRMNGKFYSIEKAAVGKNQETGVIEHLELLIRQRGVIEVQESE